MSDVSSIWGNSFNNDLRPASSIGSLTGVEKELQRETALHRSFQHELSGNMDKGWSGSWRPQGGQLGPSDLGHLSNLTHSGAVLGHSNTVLNHSGTTGLDHSGPGHSGKTSHSGKSGPSENSGQAGVANSGLPRHVGRNTGRSGQGRSGNPGHFASSISSQPPIGTIGKRSDRNHRDKDRETHESPLVPYDDASMPLIDPNCAIVDGKFVVEPRLGTHILPCSWTVWFFYRAQGVRISNYEAATKRLCTFSTVEEFWSFYGHLKHVDKLPYTSEYQYFRRGIKPMWEDKHNVRGGKWVCRLKRPSKQYAKIDESEDSIPTRTSPIQIAAQRHQAAVHWERLLLAVIGGTLFPQDSPYHDEVVGVVISVRKEEDIISVWNQSSSDEKAKMAIKDGMTRVLDVPTKTLFEYKVHSDSMKEGIEKSGHR